MKILFVCKCSPAWEGGAETRSREVAMRLARQGHEVTILCARMAVEEAPEAQLGGARLLCKKVLPDFLLKRLPYPSYVALAASNLLLMFHLAALLRAERFDLIREDWSPLSAAGLLAFRRLPAGRRVAVLHNLFGPWREWARHYGPLFGLAGYLMERALRRGRLPLDEIVCASGWLAEDLRRHERLAGRVRYVPNGVETAAFGPRPDARPFAGEVRLLSVGRLVEAKGHGDAIEALARLGEAFSHVRLDIIGGGPLREALGRLAEARGVGDRVRFLPAVPHAEMPDIYRRYDLFVLASISEGFPVVLLEAMASGLPVIASNIRAIADVIGGDALLYEAGDAGDLARQLRRALSDMAGRAVAAGAARRAVARYDWEEVARQEMRAALPAARVEA